MIKENDERVRVEATIYVERDSQKVLLSVKAAKLKEVGKEQDMILKCY